MKRIKIFDTTLRDGEQSPGASLTIMEKVVMAKQLARLGVDVIEAGFPIASEGDFEAVKAVAQSVKGPIICGLARANEKDIRRCWDAVKYAEKPRIHTFIATSKVHRDAKLRKTKEEIIAIAVEAVKFAKSLCDDVEFSPEDAARTSLDYMSDVVKAVIEAGATTINIPDTVGYAEPKEFGDRIRYLLEKVPSAGNVTISVHCHNDLGNAVANSLSAVENGATQVEGCMNGIGERAGNASLEEVVMNLHTRRDYFQAITAIHTPELYKTSKLLSDLTGLAVARNKAIVGENAFAHEAGIHQHGVLANKETYEIMTPESVGWKGNNIVIGKHSGKHAISALLKEERIDVTAEQLFLITEKVKGLADKQKDVERDDVIAIARDLVLEVSEEKQIIDLVEYNVTTGNNIMPTASIKLMVKGEMKIAAGIGDGPIDAAGNAICKLIDNSLKLEDYHLKAITGGTDALADVSVKMSDKEGHLFSGRAVDEDVITASVKAIIKAINKGFNDREKKLSQES
ncbi:MAG: 2-isopropylmalate synthase [Candidatus Marinimicrobia bacterium]|nr:2-isopropylmalate synthase [Candidatus Neomarinimicrobiota bacterium]